MFPCQHSWDSGALWVRVTSRYLAKSLKILAGNALYAYIGIELVCHHRYTRRVCSSPNSLVLLLEKRRTQDAISQLVRLYYSQPPRALLTRHQPFAAVSFVRPYLEYTLILGVAFFRIAVFYVGGVFVIGLIVPRNADVFIGGSAENKIAASPFVHGKIIP